MTTQKVEEITGIDKKQVAELCRHGELYGWKTSGPFGQWQIPVESLEYFLQYNPVC